MHVTVVVDEDGNIVSVAALANHDPSKSKVGKSPLPGQKVHEIELSDHSVRTSLSELHRRYELRGEGKEARLVEKGPDEALRD